MHQNVFLTVLSVNRAAVKLNVMRSEENGLSTVNLVHGRRVRCAAVHCGILFSEKVRHGGKPEIVSTNSFYAYMSRLKHIQRWGLMRSVQPENVAEHTFQVAIIAHALCLMHNEESEEKVSEQDVVLQALYHETAEAITGDLPTPIKYYNKEIREAYKGIEREAEHSMLEMLPEPLRSCVRPYVMGDTDPEVRLIVKAADRISAYIKCIEEKKSGNTEFEYAASRILESIQDMNMPEVDRFMERFMDAYGKTLDELNS